MKKSFTLFISALFLCMGMLSAQDYNVTFRVDMAAYDDAASTANGVFINSSFNGWCGGCNQMDDSDGDGVYEITIPLPAGIYEYKFTVDGWTDQENLTDGDPCTSTIDGFTNRTIEVVDADISLDAACWDICDACPSAQDGNITFRVDMNEYGGSTANGVFVNGTFNGWCGSCNPMDDSDMDGVWEVTLPLMAGDYEYKFTVDGWTDQESLTDGDPCVMTTDGYTNRTLSVNGDGDQGVVCWNSCFACGQEPVNSMVTFSVDMNEYGGSTANGVFLNGSFNGWCGNCTPMDDSDMDGVWEVTAELQNGTYEYKFTVDGWSDQEFFAEGDPCTTTIDGFTNRTIDVAGDASLPTVCWASCDACGVGPGLAAVTFQVDMNEYGGSTANGVFLNGSFNGWCGSCAPMDDSDMDGIWTVTVDLPQDTFEYKFTVDGWNDQEFLTEGDVCTTTIDGYTNRSVIVTGDATLDAVCWASCFACGAEPVDNNITFRVDMQDYTGSTANGVFINGTFNDWCGGCAPMDDSDGDGIWEITIPLPNGTYEFKYTVDGWNDQEELTEGDECTTTIDGFTNRTITVVSMDETLTAYCWNTCFECFGVGIEDSEIFQSLDISPNPASEMLNVNLAWTQNVDTEIRLIDVIGQTVIRENANFDNMTFNWDVSGLSAGIYLLQVQTAEGNLTRKVVIGR